MWVKPPLVDRKNLTLLNTHPHKHLDNCYHHLSPCQHKEKSYHNYYVFVSSPNTSRAMRYITLERSKHVNMWINLSSKRTFCTNILKALRLLGIFAFELLWSLLHQHGFLLCTPHSSHYLVLYVWLFHLECHVEKEVKTDLVSLFFGTTRIGDTNFKSFIRSSFLLRIELNFP